jgi:hypothetical protein
MNLFRLPEWMRDLSKSLFNGEEKPAPKRTPSARSKLGLERLEPRLSPSHLGGGHHDHHHDHHDH